MLVANKQFFIAQTQNVMQNNFMVTRVMMCNTYQYVYQNIKACPSISLLVQVCAV